MRCTKKSNVNIVSSTLWQRVRRLLHFAYFYTVALSPPFILCPFSAKSAKSPQMNGGISEYHVKRREFRLTAHLLIPNRLNDHFHVSVTVGWSVNHRIDAICAAFFLHMSGYASGSTHVTSVTFTIRERRRSENQSGSFSFQWRSPLQIYVVCILHALSLGTVSEANGRRKLRCSSYRGDRAKLQSRAG